MRISSEATKLSARSRNTSARLSFIATVKHLETRSIFESILPPHRASPTRQTRMHFPAVSAAARAHLPRFGFFINYPQALYGCPFRRDLSQSSFSPASRRFARCHHNTRSLRRFRLYGHADLARDLRRTGIGGSCFTQLIASLSLSSSSSSSSRRSASTIGANTSNRRLFLRIGARYRRPLASRIPPSADRRSFLSEASL
jgi:hypothetical protein